jgi:RimJ/RimL family protein N-acetyltransferase
MDKAETPGGDWQIVDQQRDQMLRMVTRGFYNELVNYGAGRGEILRIATHLLDNILNQNQQAEPSQPPVGTNLSLRSVQDHWKDRQRVMVDQVTLRPLVPELIPCLTEWLSAPGVADSFFPAFPTDGPALTRHFCGCSTCDYLTIEVEGRPVGIIGGEDLDRASGRVEMRKLVGDATLRGQGIGKRATFGFLYYAFNILNLHKVYIHSRDINVRNLNINRSFGFEVEGVFLEEVATRQGRRADIVRMALLRPIWLAMFGG